jgi:serine/threonine protein kinase
VSKENILIDELGRARLADFGLSIMLHGTEVYSMHGAGSYRYMAPELFDPEAYNIPEEEHDKRTRATDLYALGITIWEVRPILVLTDLRQT